MLHLASSCKVKAPCERSLRLKNLSRVQILLLQAFFCCLCPLFLFIIHVDQLPFPTRCCALFENFNSLRICFFKRCQNLHYFLMLVLHWWSWSVCRISLSHLLFSLQCHLIRRCGLWTSRCLSLGTTWKEWYCKIHKMRKLRQPKMIIKQKMPTSHEVSNVTVISWLYVLLIRKLDSGSWCRKVHLKNLVQSINRWFGKCRCRYQHTTRIHDLRTP